MTQNCPLAVRCRPSGLANMVKNASGLYFMGFQDGEDQNIAPTNGENTTKNSVVEVLSFCLKAMTANMTIDATIDTFIILEIRNNQKYRAMKNTVKIWNLEINGFIHYGDTDDLDLHYEDEFFLWGAESEKEYKEAENRISDFIIEKDLYTVWMWADISGFDYWMNTMEESNYIQVTVSFKSENFPLDKLRELREDLDIAVVEAERISEIYNWSPESYLK